MSPTFSQSSSEFGTSSALTLKLGSMDLRQELRHLILTAPLIVAPHYQCMRGCPFAWYFVISWWAIVTYVSLLTIRLSIFARLTSLTSKPIVTSGHTFHFLPRTTVITFVSRLLSTTLFRSLLILPDSVVSTFLVIRRLICFVFHPTLVLRLSHEWSVLHTITGLHLACGSIHLQSC